MSKFWESRLWETSSLKGTLLLAALAIADNADDSGVAWPGYQLIAKKTRMSVRQVPRIITSIEESAEVAVRWGGAHRGDVNTYVFLIGREQEEIDHLLGLILRKSDRMTLLKACQDVMLKNKHDKLTWKKEGRKHDMGIRKTALEPLTMYGKLDEWMNDPICNFLLELPGYNPANLNTDRAVIVGQNYSLEGLRYLWDFSQDGDNPIGLFLYRAGKGMHAPAFLEALSDRKRQAAIGEQAAQTMEQVEEREARQAAASARPIAIDASVTQPLPGHAQITPELVWQAALGELELELSRATYDTWVKPLVLLSVNGTWKIGVPNAYAQEWLSTRLTTTVRRVLTGVVGEDIQPEFVVQR